MFLAEKYGPLLPKAHHLQGKAPVAAGHAAARFDAALSARLRGLLPLPASPLAALARVADLLALALGDAVPALSGDAAAVAAHLDAGVALLDACNAITARLERLRRRRLLARLAVRLLPSSAARARAALADRASVAASSPPVPPLPFDQPRRGRLSGAARVLAAVGAVSSLAAATAAAVLGGGSRPGAFPRVSGDFPWADAFNAVSSQLSALSAGANEVDAVDEAVQNLASTLDGGRAAADEAAREVEKRTEELTARLDRLADAVNGVFRAALCLRNAEVGSFVADKTCK
jgi:hypothetical protein